jgi:hypothetical protein
VRTAFDDLEAIHERIQDHEWLNQRNAADLAALYGKLADVVMGYLDKQGFGPRVPALTPYLDPQTERLLATRSGQSARI